MPGPHKPSLRSIVAESAAATPDKAVVVPLRRDMPVKNPAGTLKQRAKQLSVYLEPPVYDQLRDIAYAERAKMHALMLEGLDLLFRERGARSLKELQNPSGD